ncbi:sulfoacetaldehyde reductase [Abditibacteriota bacterium]|nr:sulfoacetaldehyde reductase [Abditibacteriota bacterium]
MKTKIALVSGASAGIGAELARCFARGGWELHLVARREEMLQRLADELPTRSTVHAVDLTDARARQKLIESLEGVPLSCLVNNAGFGDYALFADAKWSKIEGLLQLNIEALAHLTHAFLPGMLQRKQGHILNLGSTAAFLPGPAMASYYASKAFVLSFSEAINAEIEGSGVSVTCLCPGITQSEFQERAGLDVSKLMDATMMTSEQVAREGYRAMLRGQTLVIPGQANALFTLMPRFLPRKAVARLMRGLQAKRDK